MTGQDIDISAAITLYLAHYPGNNEQEFIARYPDESVKQEVRAVLLETNKVRIGWENKTLIEIGDEVQKIMGERHPELTGAALKDLSNYFTYLVR